MMCDVVTCGVEFYPMLSRIDLSLVAAAVLGALASFAPLPPSPSVAIFTPMRVTHGGDIRGHEVWTADYIHELSSTVRVADGATLELEAGVRIEAMAGTAIIVERTSRLTAVGSEAIPIVLSCGDAIPLQGCWLGVLIAGNAPVVGGTNTSPPVRGTGAAGCAELPGDGFHGAFGGCDPDDDSGEMRFVRIEYASRGLELVGVGRGTRIASVQVHDALSTAVRLRGGTVDLRRIIASSFGGTAFAWNDGWQGRTQHLVAHRLQGNGEPALDGVSIGAAGPVLWQTTIVGDPAGAALRLRGSAPVSFQNAIIVGSASVLDLDGDAACVTAAAGGHMVRHLALVGVSQLGDPDSDADCVLQTDAEATLLVQSAADVRSASIAAVNSVLVSARTTFLPDLRPLGIGNALDVISVAPPADGFFDAVDHLGGVELTFGLDAQYGNIPWYSGWTIEGAALAEPMGAVTGTVRNSAGTALSDVRVRVSTADLSARSGTDGSYTVGLVRPGAAVVTADIIPTGCTVAPVNVTVVAGAVTTADIVLNCGTVTINPTGIRLTYICGNTFRVKNPHPVPVQVTWDVYGTSESGSLLLAPANGITPSTTFFTTTATGTVRLFYQGTQIDVKANGCFVCQP